MSTNATLKTIQDGLVFYYDTNNPKSYRGEPTTNFYTNADLSGGNNVGQEGGSNPTNEVVLFPNPGNSPYCVRATAVGGSIYTEYQLTVTGTIQANTDYTLSCWVAWTSDWDGTYSVFHMRWYNSGNSEAGSSGLEQGTTLETRVVNGLTWYRKYYTFNSGASVNGTHDWYVGYYSNNTKGYRYFTNFQLEAKNHPTQFSYGTRSVTQGLLDLTKRNTINLSNATFNSNASITFNGSTSYIDTGYILNSSAYTKFVWFNTNNLSATNNIVSGGSGGEHAFWLGGGNRLYSGHNGSWYIVQSSTLISANTWYFGAVSFNTTSGWKLYLNGALEATNAATTTFNGTTMPTLIGSYAYGNFYSGTIDMVGIYNRVLSDDEVLQLYLRTKSRYRL